MKGLPIKPREVSAPPPVIDVSMDFAGAESVGGGERSDATLVRFSFFALAPFATPAVIASTGVGWPKGERRACCCPAKAPQEGLSAADWQIRGRMTQKAGGQRGIDAVE
jgi:hypothetical protein